MSFESRTGDKANSALIGEERVETMGRLAVDTRQEAQGIELIDFGRISEVEWPGPVSAYKLIEEGVGSEAKISEAIGRINEFYVGVNPSAPTRCIDGRHDPGTDENHLGPQVPGGAPGAALAYRIGVDKGSLIRGSFLTDAENMIGTFIRLGLTPGSHRDKHSEGKPKVGCGAIDEMDGVPAIMADPHLVDDHKRVVEQIINPQRFNRDIYLRNLGAAVVLNGRREDYFRGREAVIDVLEKRSKKSVPVLEGNHQECIIVVNMVPGTTLSSNRFADSFDGMQAFGYDPWRSMQMAGKIMPRAEEAQDRERFVMARVMTTVATFMALTDGSQRLVLRAPKAAQ